MEKLILKKDEARFKKELADLAERNRGKSEWVRRQQSEKFYTDTLAKAQKRKEVCDFYLLHWTMWLICMCSSRRGGRTSWKWIARRYGSPGGNSANH